MRGVMFVRVVGVSIEKNQMGIDGYPKHPKLARLSSKIPFLSSVVFLISHGKSVPSLENFMVYYVIVHPPILVVFCIFL